MSIQGAKVLRPQRLRAVLGAASGVLASGVSGVAAAVTRVVVMRVWLVVIKAPLAPSQRCWRAVHASIGDAYRPADFLGGT